jgi:hypothetical protein
MSECKTYRTEIEDHSLGLSERTRAHVESCGACGEALRAGDSLGRILRGLERVEAPADFEFRLRARIATRRGGRGRFHLSRLVPLNGYATAAAAFCVLALSAWLYLLPGNRLAPPEARKVVAPFKDANSSNQNSSEPASVPSSKPGHAVVDLATLTPPSRRTNSVGSRGVASKLVKEATRVEEGRKTLASNSLAVSSAQIISTGTLRIPLGASAEPLRVVLRDEQGNAYVVPMRTVSFGSQELLPRDVAGARSSAKNEEGVW